MSPGRPQLTMEDLYMSGLATRLNFESSKLHCLTTVYFFALKGDSSLRSSMPLPWPLIAKPPLSSVRADALSSDSERRSLRLPPHQSQSPAVPTLRPSLQRLGYRARGMPLAVGRAAPVCFPRLGISSPSRFSLSLPAQGPILPQENGHVKLRKQHFREKR